MPRSTTVKPTSPIDHRFIDDPPPEGLSSNALTRWEDMGRFLDGYSLTGTMASGLECVPHKRRAVEYWRSENILGFDERFKQAHNSFCDRLEKKAVDLVMGLQPGQNTLLLVTLLNANLPEKYRPAVITVDDTAKDLFQKLRELGAQQRKALEAGEAPQVIDIPLRRQEEG